MTVPPPPPVDPLVRQLIGMMFQRIPLPETTKKFKGWEANGVRRVLASIPFYFLTSQRSAGRQTTQRHRSPIRRRSIAKESAMRKPLGPTKYRQPNIVRLGLYKALEFYSWVEAQCGFNHDEVTCREMCRVLARGNALKRLWMFLRENERLVGTATVTSIIKILGEEGLVDQALALFYRMKQLHCRPDVQAYNTVILALCRVGNFKKARFLLDQMELPGARCLPDSYTYTILISSYCKRSLQTGCRKAIRRRIWEANYMFRRMLFKGFEPDVVTYNCLIDGLCKTYRVERAHELFEDMLVRGCAPDRVTYNSFIRYYSVVNEVDKAVEMMRLMVVRKHGVPTCSSCTPVIHSMCESGRVQEARQLLIEMVDGGSIPREFTYKLICDTLCSVGEDGLPEELCKSIEEKMYSRFMKVRRLKPVMSGNSRFI